MQRIIRDYYEQLYGNKIDNLEEMDRFLEKFNLPSLNQEEIEIMNGASFDSGPSLLHIPYGKEELKMTTLGYQYAAASHISCHFWSGGLLGSLGLVSLLYCFTSPPLRTRVAPCVPVIPINALRLSFFIHTHTYIYTHSYTNTHVTHLYDDCTLPFS